jgi:MraZ protein
VGSEGAKWSEVENPGGAVAGTAHPNRAACGGGPWTGRGAGDVFLGEYKHSIDDKGRLVLPSKFRDRLADGLVVTKGQEHCLYVFPTDRWEIEVERVNRLPRTDRRNRNYARSFFGAASDQMPDKQGRIQLPPALREFAGLGKDVVVIGVADRLEVWDTEAWVSLSGEADELYADIEEALSEEGI